MTNEIDLTRINKTTDQNPVVITKDLGAPVTETLDFGRPVLIDSIIFSGNAGLLTLSFDNPAPLDTSQTYTTNQMIVNVNTTAQQVIIGGIEATQVTITNSVLNCRVTFVYRIRRKR